MKKTILGLIAILFVTLACGSGAPANTDQQALETVVASTLGALTAAAPPPTQTLTPVNGTAITINNISFVIPTGTGTGAQVESIEAVPASDDMPWWEIGPAYNKYHLEGYPLAGTFHKPVIYVYPVDGYIQADEDIKTLFASLESILNSPGQPLPEKLPFLPAFNAAQMFYSNAQTVDFQSGKGIRYLTQYAQGPMPISNAEVFYTFQGLTSDGLYYVSAVLPISTATLAANGNPDTAVPAGGVPFDWNPESFELMPAYIDAVEQMLNATDPNAFNPSLPMLDALIQSITIHP